MTEIKTPNGIPVVASISVKRCRKCGEYKPYTEFSQNKTRPDGYSHWCKSCVKIYQATSWIRTAEAHGYVHPSTPPQSTSPQPSPAQTAPAPTPTPTPIPTPTATTPEPPTASLIMRKCKCCGKIKPLNSENFWRNSKCRGGFDPTCAECKNYRRRPEVKAEARVKTPTTLKTSSRDISLDELEDDVLISELKRRGYTGELEKTTTIKLAI